MSYNFSKSLNSLPPGRYLPIGKHHKTSLRKSQNWSRTGSGNGLVPYHQAAGHNPSQCRPKSILPHGVHMSQCVKFSPQSEVKNHPRIFQSLGREHLYFRVRFTWHFERNERYSSPTDEWSISISGQLSGQWPDRIVVIHASWYTYRGLLKLIHFSWGMSSMIQLWLATC